MPEFPWQMIEKGIKSLREVGMLEWIYYVRTKDPPNNSDPGEGPKNTQFTNPTGMCGDRSTIFDRSLRPREVDVEEEIDQ